MEFSKKPGVRYLLVLLVIALLFPIMCVNASAADYVPISGYTEVNSITYNGKTVIAIYKPYDSFGTYKKDDGSIGYYYSSNPTYCCAAFVSKFYREVYGVTVSNLGGKIDGKRPCPTVSGGGSFYEVSTPQVGDIVRWNSTTHWAIVKKINGTKIEVIEQNAWNENRTAARVGYEIDPQKTGVTFFRYSGAAASNIEKVIVTVTTTNATEVTETSARLNSSLKITGGTGRITKHGMYLGTDPSRLTIIAEDIVDYNKSSLTMFYSTTKYGQKLVPGTTYYYQAYAVINGTQHTGEICSFTTPISVNFDQPSSISPKISLSNTSMTMKDDVCRELNATTTPSGQKVTWRSSNTSVATVENGKITGWKPGTTTITAEMTYEGKTYSATCEVTVTASECTAHTKGRFLRYDSEHPHYNYYTCSKCGETFKDSSTSTASNCMSCVSCTVSTNSASNVTSTSAQLNGSLSASSNVKITEHGAYLGTSRSNMVLVARDYVNYSKSSLTMFYNTTKYGPTLQPGTTYYYYCYAIVNGEKIDGSVVSFTTPEEQTNAYVSTNSASNVTSTSAQLNGSLSASGNVKITEHGAYLGTSQYNMYRVAQDTVNYNKSSLTMFYNTEKYGTRLEPDTTYYYYCYAVINGETIRGSVVSFKTSAVNTGGQGTTATYYVSGTNGALAINSQPSSGYQIGRIPEGEACTVYPNLASGNWYWVEYNGVSGYAYKSYLSSVKPSTSGAVPSSSNTRTGVVTGTDGKNLAINSRPSSGYQIGRIPPGASMTVYTDKTSGNWYWVEYNGVSGYAYSKYITLQ